MPLFREEKERVISSFDFIDIVKNRAVEVFYPSQTNEGAAQKYHLTNTRFPSSTTNKKETTTSASAVILHDVNFETLIEVPITIEGDVILSVPLAIGNGGGASYGSVSGALLVSGATLVKLGNVSGAVLTAAIGITAETFSSMKMTIPKTKIRGGDYLRLHLQSIGRTEAGAGTTQVWIGWDPMGGGTHGTTGEHDFGSQNAAVDSKAQVLIPIHIDI